MKKIVLILPLILLTIICLFFLLFILLEKNPNEPPSALLYKDLPTFTSNNLYNKNINLGSNDLKEKYTLINFFTLSSVLSFATEFKESKKNNKKNSNLKKFCNFIFYDFFCEGPCVFKDYFTITVYNKCFR